MADLKENLENIEKAEKNFEKELSNFKNEFAEKAEIKERNFEKTVGALISKDQKILLVQRGHHPFRGTWTLPGGHIEEGEADEEAIIREVKEETSLGFKPEYFGSYEECFEELGWFAYVSIFKGEFKGEIDMKKVDPEEILDIKWTSFNELKDLKIGFEHRKIIDEYFSS